MEERLETAKAMGKGKRSDSAEKLEESDTQEGLVLPTHGAVQRVCTLRKRNLCFLLRREAVSGVKERKGRERKGRHTVCSSSVLLVPTSAYELRRLPTLLLPVPPQHSRSSPKRRRNHRLIAVNVCVPEELNALTRARFDKALENRRKAGPDTEVRRKAEVAQ
jgi:hypothetical protein